MKVVHFCNLYPNKKGSFERLLVNLGRTIRENGDISIICVAGQPVDTVADSLHEAGVRWYVNSEWSDGKGDEHPWKFCFPALRVVLSEKPDIVVVSFGNEIPAVVVRIFSWFCGLTKCRWVWVQHQQICDPSWLTKHFSRIRLLGWFFSCLTAVYEGGRRSLLMRGIPSEKLVTVYNGSGAPVAVKPDGWLRKDLNIPAGSTVIVCISWLVERKRVDFLIRAFAELVAGKIGNCVVSCEDELPVLILVGDGPLRGALERLATQLGVDKKIHFLGMRNDVGDILSQADIFALSSDAEACALAVIEAMSFALPVIATDAGAAREQVENGVNGYVVDRDDFQGFVESLRRLDADSDVRLAMGGESRRRWERKFSSVRSAEKHYALWRKLVESV